jgi:hypothetical protein
MSRAYFIAPHASTRTARSARAVTASNCRSSGVSRSSGETRIGKRQVDDRGDAARVRRQHHDPRGQEHRLRDGMRDEKSGERIRLAQRKQVHVELVARHLVERAEGFVEQEHLCRHAQSARDRDPHPHASGQLSGVLAGRVPEDHDFKHVLHALGAPGRRIAAEQQRQLDVSATFRQGIRLAFWKTNNISSRASAGIIPSTTSSPRSVPSGPRSVAAASTSRSRWIRSDRQTPLAWRRD